MPLLISQKGMNYVLIPKAQVNKNYPCMAVWLKRHKQKRFDEQEYDEWYVYC